MPQFLAPLLTSVGLGGTATATATGAGAGAGASTAGATAAGSANSLFGTSLTGAQGDKALGLAGNIAGSVSPSDPSLQPAPAPAPANQQPNSLADIPILGDPQVQQLLQAIVGGQA